MWNPFHAFLFFSADDGAGDGAPAAEPTTDPAADPAPAAEPAATDPSDAQAAASETTPPAAQQPDETASKTAAEPTATQQPDAAAQLAAANQRALQAELRGAAAIAGVPRDRIPYVLRLADTSGIDLTAADADAKVTAAIEAVLADLPELRGGAVGTGSVGNFARKSTTAEDPDIARIHRNILGE